MTVRIVLVNWNGADDTIACLDSIRELTYTDYHVTVIDNCSADDSVERIRRAHPETEVLRTWSNLGFAGGNNVGIRMALDAHDEFVWLLNNDTVVDSGCLGALVAALERDSRLGVATSKIYFFDRPDTIWYAGAGVLPNGQSRHVGENEIDQGQYDTQTPTGYASGCSFFARASAIREVGLMSEDYFMYWEEVDWCARFVRHDWGIEYVPASRLWHKVGGSLVDEKATLARVFYDTRNSLYYHWRHARARLPRLLWLVARAILGTMRSGQTELAKVRTDALRAFLTRRKGPMTELGRSAVPGVNLFGYVTANLGLAMAARNTLRMLQDRGVPSCAIDIDPGGERAGKNSEVGWHLRCEQGPFAINLFHMNPLEIDAFILRGPASHSLSERLNVCVPFWELPRMPQRWLPMLEAMDAVLAPSKFILDALTDALPNTRIIHYPQAVFLPDGITANRQRFGLPEGAVVFGCAFDMHSDMSRKNPWAAIAAFEEAFGEDPAGGPDVCLAVKVANAEADSNLRGLAVELRDRAAANSRIRLITEDLSYANVLSFYASCDVVVSLHRSEGLGLVPMEAMSLGKPVIATAWSGNMDFMTKENSCLVSFDLVPVEASSQVAYSPAMIGEGQVWAEPHVAVAAEWMRELATGSELRRALGERAALDLRTLQERYLESEWVDELMGAAVRPIDPNRPCARPFRSHERSAVRRRQAARLKRAAKRLMGRV